MVGDLLDGLQQVMGFFAVAAAIAAAIIFWWTRCVRSTVLVLACSLIAVLWQLWLVTVLGSSSTRTRSSCPSSCSPSA